MPECSRAICRLDESLASDATRLLGGRSLLVRPFVDSGLRRDCIHFCIVTEPFGDKDTQKREL